MWLTYCFYKVMFLTVVNPLNAELNPICHLLALFGAHHILHVSRIRVNLPLFILQHNVIHKVKMVIDD